MLLLTVAIFRQDWALNYHIDLYKNNEVVIGVHGIDPTRAHQLIAESGHLHDCLPYVIVKSSIVDTQFVYCMMNPNHEDGQQLLNLHSTVYQQHRLSLKPSTKIKVAETKTPGSSIPNQELAQLSVVVAALDKYSTTDSDVSHRYALFSGVFVDPTSNRKYGFTVGHVFNAVNDVCRNEDDEVIGTCIAREMFMEPFFMDLALIQLVDMDCFADENVVPHVPRDTSLHATAAGEPEDAGRRWNLRLAQPEVDEDGLIRVLVLNKYQEWKRGVIKEIDATYKLVEGGERKLFKHTMLITRSETESVAITEAGDSGAIVVQDPYHSGGANKSSSSTELLVYGIVTCVANDNSYTMANRLVDSIEKIDDGMAKSWKLYESFQNCFDSGFQT